MNRSPHCLKRFLHLPHRSSVDLNSFYNSSLSIFSFLKRFLLRTFRFFFSMDPFVFSLASPPSVLDDDFYTPDPPSPTSDPLVLVPFSWWYEANVALDGKSEVGGVLYDVKSHLNRKDSFDDADIVLDMRSLDEAETRCQEDAGSLSSSDDSSNKCFALIAEWMFTRAFKWHNDRKDDDGYLAPSDSIDLVSLQIRVTFVHETSTIRLKINQKDNDRGAFDQACKIFYSESGLLLRLWDIQGQTTQFLKSERIVSCLSDHLHDEVLLKLQVFGTSLLEVRETYTIKQPEASSSSGPLKMDGSAHGVEPLSGVKQPVVLDGMHTSACALGFTGLYNVGNTCFMNSALQCLVHTVELVDYFVGDFHRDLNSDNPLGMNGKLAVAFGDLLRKLWVPGALPVVPKMFKSVIAGFAPQFDGYNQHDVQEFLAFLLDGLHEDLNRVKQKPYIEVKDGEGRPDDEVADEHWSNHLARNNSIIVDLFQGQYRSTLVCPICGKLSITFDPFMYLSLPLPSTSKRRMTLTVFSTDGITLPSRVTISVSKFGTCKDLFQALNKACSLEGNETLLVAEVYESRILRFLDVPSDTIELIRDEDKLVAYRFPKCPESYPIVVFNHQHHDVYFGVPLVSRMPIPLNECDIHIEFLKLVDPLLLVPVPMEGSSNEVDPFLMHVEGSSNEADPFLKPVEVSSNDADPFLKPVEGSSNDDGARDKYEDANLNELKSSSAEVNEFHISLDENNMPGVSVNVPGPLLNVAPEVDYNVSWPDRMMEDYDIDMLCSLPEVCKSSFFSKKPRESVSLNRCLRAFLKEESLGSEDMWYCPTCKTHQQANKKLDLWRLPEILIIHLKRFSFNKTFKNKLETFVDFPIDDFDLSNYVINLNKSISHRYKLYAISNHSGGTGNGHYTAFVHHRKNRWFEFDDKNVYRIDEDLIKSPSAYVLFYRRISDGASNTER